MLRSSEDKMDQETLYNTLKVILHACKTFQYAWPFLNPVDRKVDSQPNNQLDNICKKY